MKKQKTVILDSSVWIAYFYSQDSHHQRALEVVNKYKNCCFLLPEIVYFETIIKSYKLSCSRQQVVSISNYFHRNHNIKFIHLNFSNLEKLVFSHLDSLNLKSSDFQILIYVIKFNPSFFFSFDKKCKKEYSKISI